jgi:tetratricopeptide (TPR) repeat protein
MMMSESRLAEKARVLYCMGRCPEAIHSLSNAYEKAPSQATLAKLLVEFLIDSEQPQAAIKVIQKATLSNERAIPAVLSGLCYLALGDMANAEKVAFGMLPHDPANALVLQARIALRASQLDQAEQLLRRALSCDPGCGRAWQGMGQIYRVRKEPGASLECFEKAFRIHPDSREITLAFHEMALTSARYQEIESAFREALISQPLQRRIRFLLIDILLRQELWEQAMHEVESAMVDFGVDGGILAAALNIRQRLGPPSAVTLQEARNRVSLCMIVKNEQCHLARCLHSARQFVDEMIVVDTGSSDSTREIAIAFGAQVFEMPWTGDFSKARNLSLSKASGNWILVLDADEVLSLKSYDDFKTLIRGSNNEAVAYSMQTRNYTHQMNPFGWQPNRGEFPEEEGSGWFPSNKVRLFRNDARIQFVNPVHELVEPSLARLNIPARSCIVPVHHFGKLADAKTHEKTKQYNDISRRKLKKNGRNLRVLKELAIQSANLGDHEGALRRWDELVRLQPQSAEAYLNMGSACWNLGRFEAAISHAQKALRIDPELKEAKFNLAIALLLTGRGGDAQTILEGLAREQPDYLAAQFLLCVAYACRQEAERAESIFEKLKALPIGEFIGEAFLDMAKRFRSASRSDCARRTLEAAFRFGCANPEMREVYESCRPAA